MSAILQPLITTLDIKPLNDDESFTTLLKQQNNAFFEKWVNHHDDLHTLYTVLCFKLSHDLSFQKKAALSEDNKDELKKLIAFYKSPLGQKSLKVLPEMTHAGGNLGKKYAEKYSENFKENLTRIMKKYPRE